MPIVACPKCGKSGNVPDQFVGKRIKCRQCSASFLVGAHAGKDKATQPKRQSSTTDPGRSRMEISPEALRMIPEAIARENAVLPLQLVGKTLRIAMSNPSDRLKLDKLRFILNCEIEPVATAQREIDEAIEQCYGRDSGQDMGKDMLAIGDGAIIVFGPHSMTLAAELARRKAGGLVIVRERLNDFDLPEKTVLRNLSLAFAHCIPSRKGLGTTQQDLNLWTRQLLEGASFNPTSFQHPDIKWVGDELSNTVTLSLFWKQLESGDCVRIACALEKSFIAHGGNDSYTA